MKKNEKIFNLPNALSFYRLLIIPIIMGCLFQENRMLFIVLICINLITDILDGLIARTFKLCTEFGAKLDSLADIGTFILSLCGFWIFENTFVLAHKTAFLLMICFYIIPQLLSLLKFKQPTSFHLYSNKIVGYIQGIFIFTFFVFGYQETYFYFMIICSCLADFEVFLLVIYLPKMISNAKSIFSIIEQYRYGSL